MKRIILLSLVLLSAGILLFTFWQAPKETHETGLVSVTPAVKSMRTVRLNVGLNKDEAALWHHHDEGSGFIPLSFFYALQDSVTGKPFVEVLSRFGFVPDMSNPSALPIGLSAGQLISAPNKALYLGVNCAACHSGMYTYQGTAMVIDGAPNILDFEVLLTALEESLLRTIESPSALLQMIHVLIKQEHNPHATGELFEVHPSALAVFSAVSNATGEHPLSNIKQQLETGLHAAYHSDPTQGAMKLKEHASNISAAIADSQNWSAEALQHMQNAISQFHNDLIFIKEHAQRLSKLRKSFVGETVAGPGRADSFDAIWDLLVQKDQETPMIAPVSIPHLFAYNDFEWIHWDGNTSSVLERDYAQAIALGANYNPDTFESSVIAQNVIDLELVARKFTAPAWPAEILGAIDQEKTARGKQIFSSHCATCHSTETLTPVEEVGTDPQRAENFASLRQDGKSYAELLSEVGAAVVQASLTTHGIDKASLKPIEHSDNPGWRTTNAYHSRPLKGIWASPPYLHNGSVPTLWDLMLPASERPQEFQVGREFDADKVGVDATRQPDNAWIFKTNEKGNSNQGHEYGSTLIDQERWELVEYLKTL